MATAVDYSYARPAPHLIVSAGYSAVFRYLGNWQRDRRAISPGELANLHGHGLRVAFVHQANAPTAEMSVKRPTTGYHGGIEDARYGNAVADQLGVPDWVPIFTPVDVGFGFPAPSHFEAIRAFFTAHLNESRRPVAAYGPYPVLEMLADLQSNGRRVEHFWQTAGASGSGQGSGGTIRTGDGQQAGFRRLSSLACAFQHYGLVRIPETDHNDVFTDLDHWSWHPDIPHDAPAVLEDLNMKAVYLPDETEGPKFWQPLDGTLIRVAIGDPPGDDPAEDPPGDDPAVDLAELGMLMAIGAVSPEAVTLQGAHAALFKRRYHPVTDLHGFHWGAVVLMVETVKRVTEAVTGVDPATITQAVADALGDLQAIPIGLTPEERDALAGRLAETVANRMTAILGAAATAAAGQFTTG